MASENDDRRPERRKRKRTGGGCHIKGIPADLSTLLVMSVKKRSKTYKEQASSVTRNHIGCDSTQKNVMDGMDEFEQFLSVAKLSSENVHVACVTFLIEMVENLDLSWFLRLAGLDLLKLLLLRSKAGREKFAGNSPKIMNDLIQCVFSGNGVFEHKTAFAVKLQENLACMFGELSCKFSRFYPRLVVASRYVEDSKGIVTTSSVPLYLNPGSRSTVLQLRTGRDAALLAGDKEAKIVQRLVQICNDCFEKLVPRLSDENHDFASHRNNGFDSDDDVDWEEGDSSTVDNGIEHQLAVEKTLQTIGLHRGAVEIDFGTKSKKSVSGNDGVTYDMKNRDQLRKRLHKCIQRLECRHYPTLLLWTDSLVSADNEPITAEADQIRSYCISSNNSASMKTTYESTNRGPMLRVLLDAKNKVANILAKASKLGIFGDLENVGAVTETHETIPQKVVKQKSNLIWSSLTKNDHVMKRVKSTSERIKPKLVGKNKIRTTTSKKNKFLRIKSARF